MGCYPSKGIVNVPSSRTVSTIDVKQYPPVNDNVVEGKANKEKEDESTPSVKSGENNFELPFGLMPSQDDATGITNSENEKKPVGKTNIPTIRLPPSLFEASPLNSTIKRPLSSPMSERPIPTQQLLNPDNPQDAQYANVIQSIVRGYILRKHHKLRLQQLEFSFLKSVNPDNIKPTANIFDMYNISLPMDLAEEGYLIPSAPMGNWNLVQPNNNNNLPIFQHGTSSLAGGSVISTVSSPTTTNNSNTTTNNTTPSKSPISNPSLFSPPIPSSPFEPSMESLLADDKDKVKYGSYRGVPLYHRKSSMTALPPSPTLNRKESIPPIRDDSVIASKSKEMTQSEDTYTPRSRGRTMGSVVDPSLLPKLNKP